MTEHHSSDIDANILLPNLNSSKPKSKLRSPIKQKIKNRRNLSIKQSWDKKSMGRKIMTTKNSDFNSKKLSNQPFSGKNDNRVQGAHDIHPF